MQASQNDQNLLREIGHIGLLFTAVGSIIGSGWLFGALNAAQAAGPASIIAWAIGAILIILIGLCYAELGTMLPVSGGVVRFPHFAFGSFASYTLGWITWLAAASVTSIEVVAALQYANNYLPWLQKLDAGGSPVLTLPGFVVAICMLALFSLVNVVGIGLFAKLNNVLVWWKLIVVVIVVIAFFAAAFSPAHFFQTVEGGFLPNGWSGVFSSVAGAGIIFSYLGFRQGVELAGETKNPQRSVPFAIIGSVVITFLIYVALQIAFIGALPPEALANGWAHIGESFQGVHGDVAATFGPLAALAGILGLSWLAILLYIDAFISPADTGLIFATVTARISYAMGKNTNAPASLAKVNRRGVPWVSVILTFVAGTVFLLPFPGWQKLVGFVTSATVLSFGSGPLALLAMRKQLPDLKRPFRLPYATFISYLAFLSANLIVYWSGWDTVWKLMLATSLGYGVLIWHEWFYGDKTPSLDLKHGSWVIAWLAGLTLISYFGSYPDISAEAGNIGLLNGITSTAVMAVFSAAILWMAICHRLPDEQARSHLSASQS
ncbi:Amino acid permease family protein [gamma proteobacterium HdN1]|nr:Amino acid permease family protein [gamma proteobacterium HdN1]